MFLPCQTTSDKTKESWDDRSELCLSKVSCCELCRVCYILYSNNIYIPLFESFSFDGFGMFLMFILSTLLSIDIWHKNSCKELFACERCTSSCWDW